MSLHYVIRTDQPFPGYVQSFVLNDGTVAYTDGLSLDDYAQQRGYPVKAITEAELDELIAQHTATLITKPEPIDLVEWDNWLNCLPPCRWQTLHGVELFHVSERIQHDLVHWCGRIGDHYFTFVNEARADMAELARQVKEAAL